MKKLISYIWFCVLIYSNMIAHYQMGFASENTIDNASVLNKREFKLGAMANSLQDYYLTIYNRSSKNLHIIDNIWVPIMVEGSSYKLNCSLNLPSRVATIIPPNDSIIVEIDAHINGSIKDSIRAGELSIIYAYEGEEKFRVEKINVSSIDYDKNNKYAAHFRRFYTAYGRNCKYPGRILPPISFLSMENYDPDKVYIIDSLIVNHTGKEKISCKRKIIKSKNKSESVDTNFIKWKVPFFLIDFDASKVKKDVITGELRLHDSATNTHYIIRDTLFINSYKTNKLRRHSGSWVGSISDIYERPIYIENSVCDKDTVIIDSVYITLQSETNVFELVTKSNTPYFAKVKYPSREVDYSMKNYVKLHNKNFTEPQRALVTTIYRNKEDRSVEIDYFAIIVYPD